MGKEWYCNYTVTTKSGKQLKYSASVTDPAKHYGEHLKRFYPTAVKIEWTPVDASHKNAIGPTRTVEFDADGKVTRRTPDHDPAHVGRGDFEGPEDLDWTKSGDSRAGLHPDDDKSLGRHPTHSEEDEEDESEEGAEPGTPAPAAAAPAPAPAPQA